MALTARKVGSGRAQDERIERGGDDGLLDVEDVFDDIGELVELLGRAAGNVDGFFDQALVFGAVLLRCLWR